MKRSLQWRLTFILGCAILLAGIAIALMSFILAYNEAKEFQDDVLRQIALLTSRSTGSHPQVAKGLSGNDSKINYDDPESRINVMHLSDSPRPTWLTDTLLPGFHTLETSGERLRVFLQKDPSGDTIMVSQPTDIRDEISINSALRIFAPLLLLLPAMAWLIMRIVRRELKTVKKLAAHVDAQPVNLPRPLPDHDVPEEIAPFVHAIDRLLKRVTVLMEQQRRFVADAAHELRSPLTALSIQAENLNQPGTQESMSERIESLQTGIKRAGKLTEQLLNLARIQSGTTETTMIDVSKMARDLIAEYLPSAEARQIDLGLDETAELMLPAVAENLYLILKNALENALKYCPQGGEVTLGIHLAQENVVLEIIDNGPGIPDSERQKVFDPFYRLPETGEEGSGLGLAIAMEAAVSQGGIVSLHNRQDGPGLIFRYSQRIKSTSVHKKEPFQRTKSRQFK